MDREPSSINTSNGRIRDTYTKFWSYTLNGPDSDQLLGIFPTVPQIIYIIYSIHFFWGCPYVDDPWRSLAVAARSGPGWLA